MNIYYIFNLFHLNQELEHVRECETLITILILLYRTQEFRGGTENKNKTRYQI